MTRWYGSRVDLKSQKFVDVSLDSIVAAMKIPRDVGKPPWSRNNNNGNNYRGGGRGDYRGGGGGGSYNNNSRRYYEPPPPRVKRLRDDRNRSRPRGWNQWSQTGGMYSDRRGGGREGDYGYGGWSGGGGGGWSRAPRYSSWYNRRQRYGDDDEDWVDEDGGGDGYEGGYGRYGNGGGNGPWGNYSNYNRRGWNGGNDGYNNRYGGGGYNNGGNYGSRSQLRQQQSAFSGRGRGTNEDDNDRMDTTDGRSSSLKIGNHNNKILNGGGGGGGDGGKTSHATSSSHKVLHWPTLLISNLNPAVTDLDIYDLFQEFGNLKRANVHHDKYGNSLQTADVVFFSEDDARRALRFA